MPSLVDRNPRHVEPATLKRHANALRAFRASHTPRLTQAKLADLLACSWTTIAQWEGAKFLPLPHFREKLAAMGFRFPYEKL